MIAGVPTFIGTAPSITGGRNRELHCTIHRDIAYSNIITNKKGDYCQVAFVLLKRMIADRENFFSPVPYRNMQRNTEGNLALRRPILYDIYDCRWGSFEPHPID